MKVTLASGGVAFIGYTLPLHVQIANASSTKVNGIKWVLSLAFAYSPQGSISESSHTPFFW
jgi:hypothetical protein